jgi:hypothetical protein
MKGTTFGVWPPIAQVGDHCRFCRRALPSLRITQTNPLLVECLHEPLPMLHLSIEVFHHLGFHIPDVFALLLTKSVDVFV